ncbi:MAG: right-handed parallel beta-helix repeat-containing protein, partial [Candidatus Micrarchaeota archaeon]
MLKNALILLLFSALFANAATYYVDKDSRGGPCSDSNAGTSLSSPLCTIHRSIAVVQSGDTVYVRFGTYNEISNILNPSGSVDVGTLYITKSGLPGRPLTFKGYPGEPKPIITGYINGQPYMALGAHPQGQSNIVIEGFEFTKLYMGVWFSVGHNITIRNNLFHDNKGNRNNNNFGAVAIFFNGDGEATGIVIDNNTMYDNIDGSGSWNSGGIWVYSCNDCTYSNNDISLSPNGIKLKGEPYDSSHNGMISNNLIYGNVIHDVYDIGIGVVGERGTPTRLVNVTVYGNIVYNASGNGYDV